MQHLPLLIFARCHSHDRADSVTIRFGSDQLHTQTVVRNAITAVHISRAAIRREKNIERPVVIYVSIGCSASHFGAGKTRSERIRNLLKLSTSQVAKHMGRFGIRNALLYSLNRVFDMSVSYKNVRPTVIVVVKKENAKAQCRSEERRVGKECRS